MALRVPLFFDGTEGTFGEVDQNNDSIELGALTMNGAVNMNTNQINGLSSPSLGTDAANKAYVDSVAAGLDPKESVRVATTAALPAYTAAGSGVGKTLTADANGALAIDGVSPLSIGDRVLVKDEGTGTDVDNGIYTVTDPGSAGTPWELTRATDFDEDNEVTQGAFTFVGEGTANQAAGYVLITSDPITVDTTAMTFSQFAGSTSFVGGDGVDITGSTISVDLAGTTEGEAGLEFNGGKLRVQLNGTTLERSASGLAVLGLPSLFTINGVAVTANVTANNLSELTGGTATTLHTHTEVEGANAVQNDINVDSAVSNGDPVYLTATGDRVASADADQTASAIEKRVIGVAEGAQAVTGSPVTVVSAGIAEGVLAGATPGSARWLGAGGGLSTTPASGAGDRRILMGFAVNATDLFVQIQDFGRSAGP